jgi:hypothetical protein
VALSSVLLRSQTLLSSARAINFEPSNPDSAAEELSVDVELSIVIILACLIFPLIVLFKPFGFVITCLSFIKMRLQRSCFHSEVDIDQSSGMMSSRAEQTVVESPQIIPISFNAAQKPESKPSMPPDPYNPAHSLPKRPYYRRRVIPMKGLETMPASSLQPSYSLDEAEITEQYIQEGTCDISNQLYESHAASERLRTLLEIEAGPHALDLESKSTADNHDASTITNLSLHYK